MNQPHMHLLLCACALLCIMALMLCVRLQGTYYYMGWRFKQPWTSELLPEEKKEELGAVDDEVRVATSLAL